MKWLGIYLVLSFLFMQSVKSQSNIPDNSADTVHKIYKVKLITLRNENSAGYLMAIKDSAAFLFPILAPNDPFHKSRIDKYQESNWDGYKYKEIKSIRIRHTEVKTMLIIGCAIGGAVVGGFLVAKNAQTNSLDIPLDFANIFASGVLGAFIGGAIGAGAGWAIGSAIEKKYMINGNWETLQELKASLK